MVGTAVSTRKTATESVTPDRRRITEADPDFLRVRASWQRRLMASVRELQRDIERGGEHAIGPAQSAFIHRHIGLLRDAYLAGHLEGQRDYWAEVSLQPQRWARERRLQPAESLVQRRLLFYAAASVVKLSREVAALWRMRHTVSRMEGSQAKASLTSTTIASTTARLADPPANLQWNKFTAWAAPRIGLQADVTWSAFQDGYLDAATADQAGLKLQVFWELGEVKTDHCDDCPQYAAGSPYDAPGSAASGGNELDATPGDGHTACGANCKCSLRYGWVDVRGMAARGGTAADNELLIPPGETPAHVAPPLPGVPPVELPQRPTVEPGAPGEPHAAPQPAPPGWPLHPLPGVPPVELPQPPPRQQIVDTVTVNGQTTRDILGGSLGSLGEPQALAALNDGQKQALDDVRGIALLWDAIRGQLPDFETYFDPASAKNLWQNRDLAGLDQAQRELVARFFKALGDFQDASPLDEG